MLVRNGLDCRHVGKAPVEMDRQDGAGARCDRTCQLFRIHGQGAGIHVDKNRRRPAIGDGSHRRDKGGGHRDYLVARLDAGRQQGQLQRRRSAADGDHMPGAAIVGKVPFEPFDLLAQDILPAAQGGQDGALKLVLDVAILPPQVQKRDHDATFKFTRSIG